MYKHARDRYPVSDIACIAVKHQDRNALSHASLRRSNVECGELLAIRGRYHKFFEVADAELGWARDFCSRIGGDMGWINEGSVCISMRMYEDVADILLLEI